jgi:DNA helicase-2/ATP-dependent DNA helicase PcrA
VSDSGQRNRVEVPLSGRLERGTTTTTMTPLDAQFRGLNPAQREAVFHTDGPLLVLAGAGSGKTRVVTLRIARLLASGEAPRSILAVTFTNKAAKEMKERLIELAGRSASGVLVSTFHALCARLLRRDAHRIGLSPNFAILDEGDQRAQLLTVARQQGLQLGEKEPRLVLGRIGYWKNQGLRTDRAPLSVADDEAVLARLGRIDDVASLADRLWVPYASHLRALSAVDFDDLLLYARELLETTADVRKRYQHLFRYLHIDEYQDTNPLQLDIVRLLCGPHKNLAVVGDDDQAIYSFRGADVENILAFDRHFSPCTVVKLEENYRSTGHILDAANGVIRGNVHRKDKTLKTSGGPGAPVSVLGLADGDAEADVVAGRIQALIAERIAPDDIAILYRASPQSRLFEEALRLRAIPYRVVGGMEFFARKEVKDTLALIALIARPDDELSFRRVVNLPARGLGEKAIATFIRFAREQQRPLVDVAASLVDFAVTGLKPAQHETLRRFAAPLVAARARVLAEVWDHDKDVTAVVRRAVYAASIEAIIQDEPELEAKERWRDTVDELMDALASFIDTLRDARTAPDLESSAVALQEVGPEGPLATFLDRVSLDDDDDDDVDDDKKGKGKVQLMSLHASKGLEFPCVFLVGLEEGLLPHRRVLEEGGGKGIEEERRLCYVGITRARRELVITHALVRRKRHEFLPRRVSRFVLDIPPHARGIAAEAPPADPAADFFAKMRARFDEKK